MHTQPQSFPDLTAARVQREQAFPEFIGSTVAVGRGQQRAFRSHASSPVQDGRQSPLAEGILTPRAIRIPQWRVRGAGANPLTKPPEARGETTGPYQPTPRMLKKKGVAQKLNISLTLLRRKWSGLKLRGFPQPDPDIGTTDGHAIDQWLDRENHVSEEGDDGGWKEASNGQG